MSLSEREFIAKTTEPVLRRLQDMSVDFPRMPESQGNVFTECQNCRGKGYQSEERDEEGKWTINCSECGGSGHLVRNQLFEWKQEIMKLYLRTLKGY